MATTKNPFVSALEGFAVDPEAQAKGQVYLGQTAKLGNENTILQGRIAARNKFLADPNIPESVKQAALANGDIDPYNVVRARGHLFGTDVFFGADGKPKAGVTPEARSAGFAGMGMNPNDNIIWGLEGKTGPAPSSAAPKGRVIKEYGGLPYEEVIDKDGKVSYVPVPGVQNVTPSPAAVPGDKRLTVTRTTTDKGVETKIEPTVVPGGQMTSMADLLNLAEARRKSGIGQLGKVALDYPTGPYGYLLDEALGRLGVNGSPNNAISQLNPLQQRSIMTVYNRLVDAGYSPREAFKSALDAHPDVLSAATSGKFKNADFNRQWTDLSVDDDAAKKPLPDLGGVFRMPETFVYKGAGVQDYSNLNGRIPVPFMTLMASQPDMATAVAAGQAARPSFADKVPEKPELATPGQYYYSGTEESPRFVVARTQEGKIVLVPITGLNQ